MEIVDLKAQFKDFIDTTADNRALSRRDRDYKDHKQWTSEESSILKSRGQAPIVINRIKPKHDFLLGLERQNRTDPKAFARTPQHEKDSEAITDALRYVADNTDFDHLASDVFDEVACEGYGASIIEMEGKEIRIRQIPWDRFYYDPHSRRRDFKDASYMGITTWLYRDELIAMFPKKEAEIMKLGEQMSEDEDFEDKPLWLDRSRPTRPRYRINEHYFKKGGKWYLQFFTGDLTLSDEEESPFKDYDMSKEGVPTNPIEANSCYIDRDNNRYGIVRGLVPIQDEINHRRSKALHMLSSVTVVSEKGAIEDGERILDQLTTGKAHIEVNPGATDSFQIDRNQELSTGQLTMLQEAKEEIDSVGVNATLAGKDERSLSGRAIQAKQQGGVVELAPIFDGHNDWKKRVFRQIWNRIKQFWNEERWVRVTDDESNVRFVGLNRQVTGRDLLAQQFGVQPEQVEQVLAQEGIPLMPGQLERVTGIDNDVSKIDVDVIIENAPDMVTMQDEQFQVIANLAQSYPDKVPFEDVVKLSTLRGKEEFLERVSGDEEQRQAAQAQAMEQEQANRDMERQVQQAEIISKVAKAKKDNADAEAQQIENALVESGLIESLG